MKQQVQLVAQKLTEYVTFSKFRKQEISLILLTFPRYFKNWLNFCFRIAGLLSVDITVKGIMPQKDGEKGENIKISLLEFFLFDQN